MRYLPTRPFATIAGLSQSSDLGSENRDGSLRDLSPCGAPCGAPDCARHSGRRSRSGPRVGRTGRNVSAGDVRRSGSWGGLAAPPPLMMTIGMGDVARMEPRKVRGRDTPAISRGTVRGTVRGRVPRAVRSRAPSAGAHPGRTPWSRFLHPVHGPGLRPLPQHGGRGGGLGLPRGGDGGTGMRGRRAWEPPKFVGRVLPERPPSVPVRLPSLSMREQ